MYGCTDYARYLWSCSTPYNLPQALSSSSIILVSYKAICRWIAFQAIDNGDKYSICHRLVRVRFVATKGLTSLFISLPFTFFPPPTGRLAWLFPAYSTVQ